MSDFIIDFLRGQWDCEEGKPRKQNESVAYNRGYSSQSTADNGSAIIRGR